ncbi:MAG: hypothetical protein AAF468_04700 [Pseudomonadota bacterium]
MTLANIAFTLHVALAGFAVSAFITHAVRAIWQRPSDLKQPYDEPSSAFASVLLCLVCGPYLLFSGWWSALKEGTLALKCQISGAILVTLWSLCQGVVDLMLIDVLFDHQGS